MARKRMQSCNTPGCGAIQLNTHCPTHAREADRARGTRQERGYDRAHELERARRLPAAYGTRCLHCDEFMWPHEDLHLDHTEDRTGYRGIVHAHCNTSEAARRGNAWRISPDA